MIAVNVCMNILNCSLPLPQWDDLSPQTVTTFVRSLNEGNCPYDASPAARGGHLLGVFDAVDFMPASTVKVAKELGFWNSSDCIGI